MSLSAQGKLMSQEGGTMRFHLPTFKARLHRDIGAPGRAGADGTHARAAHKSVSEPRCQIGQPLR